MMQKNRRFIFSAVAVVLILAVVLLTGYHSLPSDEADTTEQQNVLTDNPSSHSSDSEEHSTIDNSSDLVNATTADNNTAKTYTFRNVTLLKQHYEKHGIDMGFDSAEEYEAAAGKVVTNPDALHKKEAEDNDDVYYVEATNEFVIVSVDGYIRTYFKPDKGIDYYYRQ